MYAAGLGPAAYTCALGLRCCQAKVCGRKSAEPSSDGSAFFFCGPPSLCGRLPLIALAIFAMPFPVIRTEPSGKCRPWGVGPKEGAVLTRGQSHCQFVSEAAGAVTSPPKNKPHRAPPRAGEVLWGCGSPASMRGWKVRTLNTMANFFIWQAPR